MEKILAGKNIKAIQFILLCINLVILITLLIKLPFHIAILIDFVFLMILYLYIKLYKISLEDDYFIIENLFYYEKIKKDKCIGIRSISTFPVAVMSIVFSDNKEYRFQINSLSTYKHIFPIGGKTAEDVIFEEIQDFIDKPNKNDN